MHKFVLVLPLAAAAVLAGCGGSSSKAGLDAGTTTPPAESTTTGAVTSPPASTTTSSSAPVGPGACVTTNLAVSLGSPNGAAGSSYYPLHFVNKGSASCTMTGFPGVSFVAPGSGQQVGAAATRSQADTAVVTLAPGGQATAVVQIAQTGNFSPADCGPTAVSGLRVYPPGNTAAAYVPFPGPQQECSKDLTSTGSSQLIIRPVKAGTTGI